MSWPASHDRGSGYGMKLLLLLIMAGCVAGSELRSPQYQACLDLRDSIRAEVRRIERATPGSIRVWMAEPHCRRNMK